MSNSHQRSNLPPFLKQFDPFAILEPEKLAGSVDLIDNHRRSANDELNGSFLTAKKEADVLDLFDNLFVTPQQVTNGSKSFIDEEFSKFIDNFETPKVDKLIDLPTESEPQNIEAQADMDSNTLLPKTQMIDDDLIKQLLLTMCVREKTTNKENTGVLPNDNAQCRDTKVKDNVGPKTVVNGLPNKPILVKHTPSKQCKVVIETVSKDPKVFLKRRIVKPEAVTSNYTKGADLYEKSVVLPQIMERLTKWKMEHDVKKNLPRKLLLDTNNTIASDFKEENSVKTVPIKGENSCQCKKVNPEEFLITKNGIKYVDLRAKNNINNVTPSTSKNGSTDLDKHGLTSSSKSKAKIAVNSPSTSKNALNDFDKYGINTSGLKDIQKGILKALISNPSGNIVAPKVKDNGNSKIPKEVELSPVVLMEDCNKERLTEFTRRQLFQKFVNGEI